MADEVRANLENQLADMTAKNAALQEQLKNALAGKIDDIKLESLSIQDNAAAKIQELTAQNEKLQGIVKELQDKVQTLTKLLEGAQTAAGAVLGGASASAAGAMDNAADQASDAADVATEQAAQVVAEGQNTVEEAQEKVEEAQEKVEETAAAAANAVGNIAASFGW